jgi:hypothetical protein
MMETIRLVLTENAKLAVLAFGAAGGMVCWWLEKRVAAKKVRVRAKNHRRR